MYILCITFRWPGWPKHVVMNTAFLKQPTFSCDWCISSAHCAQQHCQPVVTQQQYVSLSSHNSIMSACHHNSIMSACCHTTALCQPVITLQTHFLVTYNNSIIVLLLYLNPVKHTCNSLLITTVWLIKTALNIKMYRVMYIHKYAKIFIMNFMLGSPCILNYMNNNQNDALFIFSLLSYHTSTCFGRINSPPSGGRMYIWRLSRK
jgi:hypothetical protein